jgi:transcriptional regulator with XRE-family HTH domain
MVSLACQQLYAWRLRNNLSQAAAGRICGFPQSVYADYENGRKEPRIARALSIRERTEGAVPIESWAAPPTTGRRTGARPKRVGVAKRAA